MNKKNIILVLLLIVIIIGGIYIFLTNRNVSYELAYQKSIPDIQLSNSLVLNGGLVSGSVTGFVSFNNPEDQPKSFKQYVSINPLEEFDENNNQLFSVQDIIVMDNLPITYMDPVILRVKEKTYRYITIVDTVGNKYDLIFDDKRVLMYDDSDNGVSILITNNYEMTEYLTNVLLNSF